MKQPTLTVLPSLLSEFPEVRGLRFEGLHSDPVHRADPDPVRYSSDLPRFIPCTNAECDGKGYYMKSIISKLASRRETSYLGDWSCDTCSNALRFSLKLTYHQETVKNEGDDATGT